MFTEGCDLGDLDREREKAKLFAQIHSNLDEVKDRTECIITVLESDNPLNEERAKKQIQTPEGEEGLQQATKNLEDRKSVV